MTAKHVNALSIDIEDYWSIFYRERLLLDSRPCDAVVRNTRWFLETLDDFKVKATFFILGEVAREFPRLVREIAAAGHEIASHGSSHRQVFKLSRREFAAEVSDSRKLLEDTISAGVSGFRAPAFSIMPDTAWALETLAREGFQYDSSVYPVAGSRYGWPDFCPDICRVILSEGAGIIEVPMSRLTVMGKCFPVAGGGYLRHFPYFVTRYAVRKIQKTRPAIVYMHPYEIDLQPRDFSVSHLSESQRRCALRFHRSQLRKRNTVAGKLRNLLSDFEFTTIGRTIQNAVESGRLPVFEVGDVRRD